MALSSTTFHLHPLNDASMKAALETLSFIIKSCFGPYGKLKILHHSEGGAVTLTSSSQRLFHQISAKNIFVKIIISAAKSQLKLFNDGGLCCVLFILKLISCPLDYSLPLVGTLYSYFSRLYIECLSDSVFNIDFNNLYHLKCIVITILSSKPGCVLTNEDKGHLCMLLLRAFLNVIPSSRTSIRFLTFEGISAKQSKLFEGILLPVSKLDFEDCHCKVIHNPLKVALFSTSLTEDIELPFEKIENCSKISVQEMILSFVEKLIIRLISENVNFVFCQKLIHSRFKQKLKNKGIVVLDRLGSEAFKYVLYISGGEGIVNSSVSSELSYGTISSFTCEKFGKKTFLRICNQQFPSFTLILGNYNEQASAELKVVCEQATDCLFRILKDPKVANGGGCSEIHSAHLTAMKMAEGYINVIHQETGHSHNRIQVIFNSFIQSIVSVSIAVHQRSCLDFRTETVKGHLWMLQDGEFPTTGSTCQCGCYSFDDLQEHNWIELTDICNFGLDVPVSEADAGTSNMPILLDEFSCKKSSLSLAFETAEMLLRTTVCVNNLY